MPVVITTEKPVNLNQLSYELVQLAGPPARPLRAVAGRWVSVEDESVEPAVFAHALEAHVADPDWQPPRSWPPRPSWWRRLLRRS